MIGAHELNRTIFRAPLCELLVQISRITKTAYENDSLQTYQLVLQLLEKDTYINHTLLLDNNIDNLLLDKSDDLLDNRVEDCLHILTSQNVSINDYYLMRLETWSLKPRGDYLLV